MRLNISGTEYELSDNHFDKSNKKFNHISDEQIEYEFKTFGWEVEYNNIAVWDLTFYRCDDDGNELKDKSGKVITYNAEAVDCSYLAEGLDIDDLEEIEDENI